MASVRLRKDQVERLRGSGYGPEILRVAVERYRRGDFGTLEDQQDTRGHDVLVLYPIWRKPEGIRDAQLRRILDAHWAKPDTIRAERLRREMEYWRQVADVEMAKIKAMGPFVVKEAADA